MFLNLCNKFNNNFQREEMKGAYLLKVKVIF